MLGYSAIVNNLDFAAVSFPVTTVDYAVDMRQFNDDTMSPEDAKAHADCKTYPHAPRSAH